MLSGMEDVRVGQWVRSERRRQGLRQSDVAARARVSSSMVSRVENGLLAGLSVRAVRAVATAVGLQLSFAPRSVRGASIERQIDWRHAALVEAVVKRLRDCGWETLVEYSFNNYGDRGSVDVLAWHAASRTLLIVEVKSDLRDVQGALHALDIKSRVVPGLVRVEKGWAAAFVGVVMVIADLRADRGRVERHGSTFDAALPARTVEVRRWLSRPIGPLRGIWFLQIPHSMNVMQRPAGHERIRRSQDAVRTAAVAAAALPKRGPERGTAARDDRRRLPGPREPAGS
jgi:transcriptional regulator with XRE-family HTH domain